MMIRKFMSAAVAGVLSLTSLTVPTAYGDEPVTVAAGEETGSGETGTGTGEAGTGNGETGTGTGETGTGNGETGTGTGETGTGTGETGTGTGETGTGTGEEEFKAPDEYVVELIADGTNDSQASIDLTGDQKRAKKFAIKVTTNCKEDAQFAVFGLGTNIGPNYWSDLSNVYYTNGKEEFTYEVAVPKSLQGHINKIGIGIWYPKDGKSFYIESITPVGDLVDISADTPDGPSESPESENDKSGTSSFKDNGDGTATISSTLSAQYKILGNTPFELPLTSSNSFSHKFDYEGFEIEDIDQVEFQSFEYVLTVPNGYDMDSLEYTGDISVKAGSDADTETAFGKSEHRYKDHTAEEVAGNADLKISDIHAPYKATYCGGYAKIAWDVPASVQPCTDNSENGSVGFNLISAKDDNKGSIPKVILNSCTVTYTRKVTVPYNTTITDKTRKTIAIDQIDNKVNYYIDSLELSRHDILSAIKFTFSTSNDVQKFVGGFGIALDKDKGNGSFYMPSDLCVINTGKSFEVMWILPDDIAKSVWGGTGNKVQVGYWYGDNPKGTKISSVNITSVDYYIHRFPERDLIVKNSDGKEIEKVLEIPAESDYALTMSIEGCTFASSDNTVAFVDEGGIIHTLKEGETELTINTPAGQDVKIALTVTEKEVVTTTATSESSSESTSSTTTTTTTTVTKSSSEEVSESEISKTTNGSSDVSVSSSTKATTVSSSVSNPVSESESKSTSKSTATSPTTKTTTSVTTTNATTTSPKSSTAVTTTTTHAAIDLSTIIYGDVNLDTAVDLADVTWLAKYLISSASYPLGNGEPDSAERAKISADINGDNRINTIDLSRLIEFNLGKLTNNDLIPTKK